MARGSGEPWGDLNAILARRRTAGTDAVEPGHDDFAVRQRVRSARNRLRPDWWTLQSGNSAHRSTDLRRRAAQPRPRLCGGDGDGDHYGAFHFDLLRSPAPLRKVAQMTVSAAPTQATVKSETARAPVRKN